MILKIRTKLRLQNIDGTQGENIDAWRYEDGIGAIEISIRTRENNRRVVFLKGKEQAYNDLILENKDEAYLLNDEGKTIERIN